MARSYTDYQRYAPRGCRNAVKCGDYFVAFGGDTGGTERRQISVWDTVADTVQEYDMGPVGPSNDSVDNYYAALTVGSDVYYLVSRDLGHLDPATGTSTRLHRSSGNALSLCRIGNILFSSGFRYDISAGTGSNWSLYAPVVHGSRMFANTGTSILEYNTSTGATIGTWTIGGGWTIGSSIQFGVAVVGDTIWWPSSSAPTVMGFDTSTDTVVHVTPTPAGMGGVAAWMTLGDGYLYDARTATTVFDPATGNWAFDPLTVRAESSTIFVDGSDLWVASGQPTTWPL